MVTAQILSIIAFLVSWIWYVTLILGVVAMILLQVFWCCRVDKAGLYATVVISGLTSLGCFIAGALMIVTWKGDRYCHVFVVTNEDDDSYRTYYDGSNWTTYYDSQTDYCNEGGWAVVAFVTGLLWAATSICTLIFLCSGRHAQFMERKAVAENAENQGREIELGTIPAAVPYNSPSGSNHLMSSEAGRGQSEADFVIPAASFIVSDDDIEGHGKF